MNKNYICVFDFETDSSDPETCSPVELSALIIHPRQLQVVPNSKFYSPIRPEGIDDEDYIEKHRKTLVWHSQQHGKEVDQIIEEWKDSPPMNLVWDAFKQYIKKYNSNQTKRTLYTAPVAAGQNVRNFDLPIIDRLAAKYKDTNVEGRNKLFNVRDVIDILDLTFYWFENNMDLSSHKMDALRKYFGLSTENAHEAQKDVEQEAELICRFLRLHRVCSEKVTFNDSLISGVNDEDNT